MKLTILGALALSTAMSAATGAAFAQSTTGGVDPSTGARPGNIVGTGMSLPKSNNASNITASSGKSTIAPRLPTPTSGEQSDPRMLLTDARRAIAAGHTGEAQEALERAETRYLDRSVAMGQTNTASADPAIQQIDAALKAIAGHDRKLAVQIIDGLLQRAG